MLDDLHFVHEHNRVSRIVQCCLNAEDPIRLLDRECGGEHFPTEAGAACRRQRSVMRLNKLEAQATRRVRCRRTVMHDRFAQYVPQHLIDVRRSEAGIRKMLHGQYRQTLVQRSRQMPSRHLSIGGGNLEADCTVARFFVIKLPKKNCLKSSSQR